MELFHFLFLVLFFFYLRSKYFNEWTRIGLYRCNFHSIDLISELKLRVPQDKWFINIWLFPTIYHVLLPFLFDTYMTHCIVYKPRKPFRLKMMIIFVVINNINKSQIINTIFKRILQKYYNTRKVIHQISIVYFLYPSWICPMKIIFRILQLKNKTIFATIISF